MFYAFFFERTYHTHTREISPLNCSERSGEISSRGLDFPLNLRNIVFGYFRSHQSARHAGLVEKVRCLFYLHKKSGRRS